MTVNEPMSRTIWKGFVAIIIAIENPMSRRRITTFLRFPRDNRKIARADYHGIKEADSAMQ